MVPDRGARSYWRIIIAAAVGLALFGLGYGYGELERAKPNPNSAPRYQPARDLRAPPYSNTIVPQPYQPGCGQPGNREDADLCAQWAAVEAVSEGNRLSRMGITVTSAEFLALVLSLFFTGWAALAAAKAAGAADRAVEVTEDTAKRQLRAYLAVKPMGINQLAGSTKVIGHVALRNVGHLPARNVTLLVSMLLSDERHHDDFPIKPDILMIERVIQPSDEMRQGSTNTIPSKEIAGGNKYLFVWGVAYYEDGYGDRRFTRFCHRYNVGSRNRQAVGGSTILDQVYPKTISVIDADKARYHTNGNDAD